VYLVANARLVNALCCMYAGAWLYFFGIVPYPPYIAFYISRSVDDVILWLALGASIVVFYAMYLFVRATYPNYGTTAAASGLYVRL
jgi:hypothetical protein